MCIRDSAQRSLRVSQATVAPVEIHVEGVASPPLQPSKHRRCPLQHPALGLGAEQPAQEPVVGELTQQGRELRAALLGERTQAVRESLAERLRTVVARRVHLTAAGASTTAPGEPAGASGSEMNAPRYD